jgi:hypothetical protein
MNTIKKKFTMSIFGVVGGNYSDNPSLIDDETDLETKSLTTTNITTHNLTSTTITLNGSD